MKKIFSLILLCLCTLFAWAQGAISTQYDGDHWQNTKYNTTEGTEFWVTFMRNYGSSTGDNNDMSLYLYATSREDAVVTITNPNVQGSPIILNVRAGQQDSCLVPNSWAYIELDRTVGNYGVKVTSDKPISLYATNQHSSGKYDATNILPLNALLGEYVVQTYRVDNASTEFAIVATTDQEVTIHVKKTTIDLAEYSHGRILVTSTDDSEVINLSMQAGQTYLYRSATTEGANTANRATSLSGTEICSNKPLALFVGGQTVSISADPENHIFSQAYSTDQWGKTFVVTPTYGMVYDFIQITASQNNTQIRRDGNLLATINERETYIDTLKSTLQYITNEDTQPTYTPKFAVYTTNKPTECFLYATGFKINHPLRPNGTENPREYTEYGAPVLTPIAPQEWAMRSGMFATFTRTNTQLKHYVNIVTPTAEIAGMRLDGIDVSSEFRQISNNPSYSYLIKEVSNTAHKIENVRNGHNSTFTARIYGLGADDLGNVESYAYAAGSRVERSADILLNDKYIDTLEICDNEETQLEGIIRYDYTDVDWLIIDSSAISGYGYGLSIPDSAMMRFNNTRTVEPFLFPHVNQYGPKDWTVNMFVTRSTPLSTCVHTIKDTITATIRVYPTHANDTTWDPLGEPKKFCYGDPIDIDYSEDGNRDHVKLHHFTADTVTPAVINKYPYGIITFKLDSVYTIRDSLKNHFGCDSVIEKKLIIRPTYDTIMYDTICVNHLPYRRPAMSDTQGTLFSDIELDLTPEERSRFVLTKHGTYKDTVLTDDFKLYTIHGCDSIIHLKVTVLPIYEIKDKNVTTCKDSLDGYEWKKHTNSEGRPLPGHKIYLENNGRIDSLNPLSRISLSQVGTFTYVDMLVTHGCKQCDDKPGCDSIYKITITVKDQTKYPQTVHLCEDSMLVWHKKLYLGPKYNGEIVEPWKTSGDYIHVKNDTLLFCQHPSTKEGECDSLFYLSLYWCPTFENETIIHICENETYTYKPRYPLAHAHDYIYNKNHEWACKVNPDGTKQVGLYHLIDTVKTIKPCANGVGCDSVVKHTIYVHPVYRDTVDTIVCQTRDGKFIWNKHVNTGRTIWDEQLKRRIEPASISIAKAGDYTYIDDSTKTLTCTDCRNGVGCDSVWVLKLHINPIYDSIANETLCETDSLHWHGKIFVGGKAPTEWQKGQKTLYWADPKPKASDTENRYRRPHRYENIPHDFNGNRYCDSVHLYTKDGCDSIIWLNLTVYPTYVINDTDEICDNKSIVWEGVKFAGNKYAGSADYKYDVDGEYHTYEKHWNIANGCDSTRFFHLRILPTYDMPPEYDTICERELPYIWHLHDNGSGQDIEVPISRSAPGDETVWQHTEKYTLHTALGCDSIVHLELTVCPTLHKEVSLQRAIALYLLRERETTSGRLQGRNDYRNH